MGGQEYRLERQAVRGLHVLVGGTIDPLHNSHNSKLNVSKTTMLPEVLKAFSNLYLIYEHYLVDWKMNVKIQ